MRLASVPLTADNLRWCVPLWPDRRAYKRAEFDQAVENAAGLLREERAHGDVVSDSGRVSAFGMSTFVRSDSINAFLAAPHPQLGKRVLLGAYSLKSIVLARDEVARANRQGGLQLVVVAANYEAQAPNAPALFAALLVAFLDTHRGYRIERVINEAFTPDAILNAESAGLHVIRKFGQVSPGSSLTSVLSVMSREDAVATKALLLPTFIYDPPRLRLTPAEQRLLRAALSGDTDEHLSVTLGISLSSVKARWTRTLQRAVHYAPELFLSLPARTGDHRGARSRHLLLDYLRKNPSELTPYAWNEE